MAYRRDMEKKPNYQPKRIIFYRGQCDFFACVVDSAYTVFLDGVSEGQFKQVLDYG